MADIQINKSNIEKKMKDLLNNNMDKAAYHGKKVCKEIAETAIKNWGARYNMNTSSLLSAIVVKSKEHKQVKYGWVDFEVRIDYMQYPHPRSLYTTMQKHPDYYRQIQDDRQFVVGMQWEDGIIGLPDYFTYDIHGTRRQYKKPFKNPYYSVADRPLGEYVKSAFKYRFNSEMIKKYYKK